MTLPDERLRALIQVRGRLLEMCWTKGPVSKRELRRLVSALLRHYPSEHELKCIAEKVPELLRTKP